MLNNDHMTQVDQGRILEAKDVADESRFEWTLC